MIELIIASVIAVAIVALFVRSHFKQKKDFEELKRWATGLGLTLEGDSRFVGTVDGSALEIERGKIRVRSVGSVTRIAVVHVTRISLDCVPAAAWFMCSRTEVTRLCEPVPDYERWSAGDELDARFVFGVSYPPQYEFWRDADMPGKLIAQRLQLAQAEGGRLVVAFRKSFETTGWDNPTRVKQNLELAQELAGRKEKAPQ